MKIEFFRHNIGDIEKSKVCQTLDSIFLTTGDVVYEFERQLSDFVGSDYAIGLMSCTAALHLSLLAYGIAPGDEVITTPMTFVATATAIMHTGAKPVFVDVEPETGNINADLIEAAVTDKTKAILPVHLYGNMCDMRRIREIADKYSLIVIEDSAHTIEANRDGYGIGELSDAACFSFYATKSITSGEGGAVSLNNKEKAELIKQLSLHGITKGAADRYTKKYKHWDMDLLGWKYNMSNIQASLLLNQLNNADKYWQRRDEISKRYEDAFSKLNGINYPKVPDQSKSGRHLFTVWVDPMNRDETLWSLQEKGIGVAVNYRAIHLLSYFRENFGFRKGAFPIAENIGESTISIPLYPALTDIEVDYIINSVIEAVS
ncbi:MAG: DegT/DnrJ/EryC1/StrS family aminotransferase [Candidatus Omnitrophota bacterium]